MTNHSTTTAKINVTSIRTFSLCVLFLISVVQCQAPRSKLYGLCMVEILMSVVGTCGLRMFMWTMRRDTEGKGEPPFIWLYAHLSILNGRQFVVNGSRVKFHIPFIPIACSILQPDTTAVPFIHNTPTDCARHREVGVLYMDFLTFSRYFKWYFEYRFVSLISCKQYHLPVKTVCKLFENSNTLPCFFVYAQCNANREEWIQRWSSFIRFLLKASFSLIRINPMHGFWPQNK